MIPGVRQLALPLVLLGFISNLAVLVSPIFMMQVLDRVIPSGNLFTLGLLLGVALVAIGLQSVVDHTRDRSLQRIAGLLDGAYQPRVLQADPAAQKDGIQALGTVTNGLRSGAAATALNMPWLPLFGLVLFLVHPLFLVLSVVIVGGMAVLRAVAMRLRAPAQNRLAQLQKSENASLSTIEEVLGASGMHVMRQNLVARQTGLQGQRLATETKVEAGTQAQGSMAGYLRAATQLLALSLGAGLVAGDMLSPGGMIAASIIVAKLVTSMDAAASALPQLHQMRRAVANLEAMPDAPKEGETDITDLTGALGCQSLTVPRGGGAPPRLERVSFTLEPGDCLAILGASGSGKSTLLKALGAIELAPIGAVFLDQSEIKSLHQNTIARHVGYLPQRARIFPGTLAQNICSFDPAPNDDRIVEAARIAGVHGLISSLAGGYDLDQSHAKRLLSAGQQQRVALARAIYHRPRYLFLDEPNALLDAEGERQLCDALARLKESGTTIVMVIHRSGVVGLANKVLFLDNGRMSDYGPRAEVLARNAGGKRRINLPLNQNSLQDLSDWVASQFTRTGDEALRQKTILVATEVFNLVCSEVDQKFRDERPADAAPARARIEFKFIDDNRCELALTGDLPGVRDAKLAKIESLIRNPQVSMVDLPADEVALAMIAQIADAFEVSNQDGHGHYTAALSNLEAPAMAETRH